MLHYLKNIVNRFRSTWYPLSRTPEGYWSSPIPGALTSPEQALTLSAFYAGIRLYQTTLASLPLVTYTRNADGSRERARKAVEYNILHDRPNPAQSRPVFMECLAKSLFLDGDFFAFIRRKGNGELVGIYPIPYSAVEQIYVDEEWVKAYKIRLGQAEIYSDDEIIHLFLFSTDGIRGVPMIRYAAESLGLHKQVLESANAYYVNAARPSGYIRFPGKLDDQAKVNIKQGFKDEAAGTKNTGRVPILEHDAEWKPFSNTSAEDARIIEAMGTSVADLGRWFGVSPLLLGDLSRGTYSNLAADNQAFYQRSLRPLLDKCEAEFNHKVFGDNTATYCEFLVDAILRGDPKEQAEIFNTGIQAGYYLRSEIREWLNLPPVPGLDEPMQPLNMGQPTAAAQPAQEQPTNAIQDEQSAADNQGQ